MTDSNGPIGFVGLGLMGAAMAENMLAAGNDLVVWNRSDAAADRLRELGADRATTTAGLSRCPVLIFMLPDLPHIEACINGADGLLAAWDATPPAPGTILVVMSSVSPTGIQEFASRIERRFAGAATVVDAPVSGGTGGAISGSLAIMVGAEAADFDRLHPLLSSMGTTIRHMGPVGSGSLAKACNQVVVGVTTAAIAEAVLLAERSGLDVASLLEVLGGGLAGSNVLETMGPRFLSRDYAPAGPAAFMSKDLGFVEEAAAATGTATPVSTSASTLYRQLVARGFGASDLSVVHRLLGELSTPAS
ncbi:NAD(P)-dependent oxidoreductase [Micrococcaceae bacterium RIT802]|nr:NAD(P)-dependent oxidoreductase [Micrococcaceae bacterium RIT 802]